MNLVQFALSVNVFMKENNYKTIKVTYEWGTWYLLAERDDIPVREGGWLSCNKYGKAARAILREMEKHGCTCLEVGHNYFRVN